MPVTVKLDYFEQIARPKHILGIRPKEGRGSSTADPLNSLHDQSIFLDIYSMDGEESSTECVIRFQRSKKRPKHKMRVQPSRHENQLVRRTDNSTDEEKNILLNKYDDFNYI